uniref:Uncharacterized protein n=1 Tax=Amphiprion percula TaxID=161767 RepID=A0A3P8SZR9_AMPPE
MEQTNSVFSCLENRTSQESFRFGGFDSPSFWNKEERTELEPGGHITRTEYKFFLHTRNIFRGCSSFA